MPTQSKATGPAEHLFDCGGVPTSLPIDCSAFSRTWRMPGEPSRPGRSSTRQEAATEDLGVSRLAWGNCPNEVP